MQPNFNKQSNMEKCFEREAAKVWIYFFFKDRKIILILTPHNFTLRWNSFSPSNTIWIFNLTGKTTENFVRVIKHLTPKVCLIKIHHIRIQILQWTKWPNYSSAVEVKIYSNIFWYSIIVNSGFHPGSCIIFFQMCDWEIGEAF